MCIVRDLRELSIHAGHFVEARSHESKFQNTSGAEGGAAGAPDSPQRRFQFERNLLDMAAPPAKGILSNTISQDKNAKCVLFAFAAGEELSEHTAAVPAVMHFLRGSATVTIDDEIFEVEPGSWFSMQANVPHSVRAETETIMLLTLNKAAAG